MNTKAKAFLKEHLHDIEIASNASNEALELFDESIGDVKGLLKQLLQKIGFTYLEIECDNTPGDAIEFIFDVDMSLCEEYSDLVDTFEFHSKESLIFSIKEDMGTNCGWIYCLNGISGDIDTLMNFYRVVDARKSSKIRESVGTTIMKYSELISQSWCGNSMSVAELSESISKYISDLLKG